MKIQRAFCAALLFASISAPASAQVLNPVTPLDGGIPVGSGNPLHVTGSFSASLGGFVPSLSYTTITATAASSASTALPTNTGTVAFQNQTSVAVSCTLASGSATATTNEIIVPAGSTIFVGTTGYSNAACINQTGSASNVIVLAGGTGLGTGFGGGSSGGGGGGAVTLASGAVASGAYSAGAYAAGAVVAGAFVDGWDITQGAKADSAYAGSGSASVISALKGVYAIINTLNTTAANGTGATGSAVPASGVYVGMNVSGNLVGMIGTSGGLSVNTAQVNGVTALTGAGATGTGSQRNTVAQDTSTIAGSAPGTAGTPSANVVSVQGVASGTPMFIKDGFGAAQLSFAAFDISIGSDNTVIAHTSGTIKVYGLEMSCATNQTTVTMKDGASNTIGGPYYNVGTYSHAVLAEPAFTTTGTDNFVINLANATHCGGTVWYLQN